MERCGQLIYECQEAIDKIQETFAKEREYIRQAKPAVCAYNAAVQEEA
jgi:hypothetical protein